ncbi:MAG: UDP-N-acetylmuramoyl-tripeptide--D-alanyl-D-alanine ligase [Spirochaetota bacterium]
MKAEFNSTIGKAAEWAGGTLLCGDRNKEINSITTDSRELGKDSLFVPIVGERFDGHQFIDELVKSGSIAAFLTMREESAKAARELGTGAILCDDTLKAYGRIASRHRLTMKAKVIGITGTNGKTTTKELLWTILNRKHAALKNEKNYNNEIGVPHTLLGLNEDHKWAIIEMGMNHKGEIDRLSGIAKPDMAVITNVGEGHLEFLGTVENVAYAKSEIMNSMKPGSLIILNRDSRCFDILLKKASDSRLNVKTFGLSDKADMKPASYTLFADSIRFTYNSIEYNIPLYGIHNLYNAIAAMAAALELGVEANIIQEAFHEFKNIDMRSQVISDRNYTVINDTYNSNPLSAGYALKSLAEIFSGKRKVAVLSDMKELGSSSEYYHREIGKLAGASGIDRLFTWGEMAENIALGAKESGMNNGNALHFRTKPDLIDYAKNHLLPGDVILVKGSRSMKMEEVVEAIIH